MLRYLLPIALLAGCADTNADIDSDLATTPVTAEIAHFDNAPNEIVVRLARLEDDTCLRLASGTTVSANGEPGRMLSRGGENQACMQPTFGVQLVPMPESARSGFAGPRSAAEGRRAGSIDLAIDDGTRALHIVLVREGGKLTVADCDAGACEILQSP